MMRVGKEATHFGLVALLITFLSGCASVGNRAKTLSLMALAGGTGAVIGTASSPQNENAIAHGALWGGVAAASAGVIGLFIFDEEGRSRDLQARNQRIEKELASMRDGVDPELISASNLGLSKPLPERFKHLVTPGQWSLYKVDRWVSSSENELVHQDLIFRFHQPQLNPNEKTFNLINPNMEDNNGKSAK